MLGATRRDGSELAGAAVEVPDAATDVRRLCLELFEGGMRLAEYLHHARRCDDGMRAIDCAWQMACTAAVTDPKFIAGCLLRLGMANLTCGCRPTAIADRRRAPVHDTRPVGDMRALDHVLRGLATVVGALPSEIGPEPTRRQPATQEEGTC